MNHQYYVTPVQVIGKNEWRCVVKDGRWGRVTQYQFRLCDPSARSQNEWQEERRWPAYNINDGMYMGLPRDLVDLFYRYQEEIKAALEGLPIPMPRQQELFGA